MKVAFCGPSGSGKTTLAKFISENFHLNYIRGSASFIMSEQDKQFLTDHFKYQFTGHREVIEKSGNPEFAYAFENLVRERRKELIMSNDNFITDRSPVDNLVYFLTQAAYSQSDFVTFEFIKSCQEAMGGITHVIYIKSVNPNEIENNNSRIPNRYYQRMVDAVFTDTIERYFTDESGKTPFNLLVLNLWDLQYRKDAVTKFLSPGE